jgi:hypothetical protein
MRRNTNIIAPLITKRQAELLRNLRSQLRRRGQTKRETRQQSRRQRLAWIGDALM